MNKHIFALTVLLLSFGFCHAKTLNVKNFGATGDGKSIDSDAIDCAIADASRHKGDPFPENLLKLLHSYMKNYRFSTKFGN